MPTYQYSCTDCGHFFEAVQSFTDDSLTVCPECEGRLRKVFNAVGVVFKGSGFYRNDSRSEAGQRNGQTNGSQERREERRQGRREERVLEQRLDLRLLLVLGVVGVLELLQLDAHPRGLTLS